MKMSENILIGDKPLSSLRVVDLREELRKRGIRQAGTKSQLQQLLISVLNSTQTIDDPEGTKDDKTMDITPEKSIPSQNESSIEENSEESLSNSNNNNIDDNSNNNDKNENFQNEVSSLSINEKTESIKLTIRCSPRKSEPIMTNESETEESQSESDNDSGDFKNRNNNNEEIEVQPESAQPIDLDVKENTKSDVAVANDNVSQLTSLNSQSLDKTEKIPSKEEKKPEKEATEMKPTPKLIESKPDSPKQSVESVRISRRQRAPIKNPISIEEKKIEIKTTQEISAEKDKKVETTTINNDSTSKIRTSLRGRFSTQKSQEDLSTSNNKPLQKKRRWGSSQNNESSVFQKGISSDKLKELIQNNDQTNEPITDNESTIKVSKNTNDDQEPIDESNRQVDNENEPKQQQQKLSQQKFEPNTINEMKKDISFVKNNINDNSSKIPSRNDNIISTNISIEKENATTNNKVEMVRSISPAKNSESTVLFITGLVRPYTITQLKKLLTTNGPIDDEKFWIDKIKSKCYVTYFSVDVAVETRNALHKLKWPQSSPKNLCVEFATLEDIDRCLHPENYEDLPSMKQSVERKQLPEKKIDLNSGKYDILMKDVDKSDINPIKSVEKLENIPTKNIREWDREKVAAIKRGHPDNFEERASKRSRQLSPSPDHRHDRSMKNEERRSRHENLKREEDIHRKAAPLPPPPVKARSESPVNLFENLFRKTKTMPYIYWLPLTEEESIEREKQRIQHDKDREARIAQRMEMPPHHRSPPPPPMSHRSMNRPRSPPFARRRTPPPMRGRRPPFTPPMRRNTRYSRSRSPPNRRRFSPRRR